MEPKETEVTLGNGCCRYAFKDPRISTVRNRTDHNVGDEDGQLYLDVRR